MQQTNSFTFSTTSVICVALSHGDVRSCGSAVLLEQQSCGHNMNSPYKNSRQHNRITIPFEQWAVNHQEAFPWQPYWLMAVLQLNDVPGKRK